jgi:amidase
LENVIINNSSVVPESEHQDSVGTFGRTVRDAVYALDAIYGVDSRDNYTLAQKGKTPKKGYAQFLTDKKALKGATFGLPWASFWAKADEEQLRDLLPLLDLIKKAGATIINGTEIKNYETVVAPYYWDWDWGTNRGYPNESEYTVVKVDFYNNIKSYLSELKNTKIRSLEDIVQYNYDNDGSEATQHSTLAKTVSLPPSKQKGNKTKHTSKPSISFKKPRAKMASTTPSTTKAKNSMVFSFRLM